jgi:hypothetical protein
VQARALFVSQSPKPIRHFDAYSQLATHAYLYKARFELFRSPCRDIRAWNALLVAGMRSTTSVLRPLSKHERMSDFSAQSTVNDLDQENLEPCVRPNMGQGRGDAPHPARE